MNRRPALHAVAVAVALAACGGSSAPAPTTPAAPAAAAPAAPPAPAAPTADSILEAAIEATGGRAARDGLTAMRATGTFRIAKLNVEGPVEIRMQAPRKMYMKVQLGGLGSQESGTDGTVAWEKSSMTGARVLAGVELARTLRTATFNAELKWRELFAKVELAGEAEFAGRPAWKLVATSPEGEVESQYYDRETHLLLGSEATVTTQMGQISGASRMTDYAQFGPIKMARTIIQSTQGMEFEITMQSVEWNPALPADAFAVPPDVQQLVK